MKKFVQDYAASFQNKQATVIASDQK